MAQIGTFWFKISLMLPISFSQSYNNKLNNKREFKKSVGFPSNQFLNLLSLVDYGD